MNATFARFLFFYCLRPLKRLAASLGTIALIAAAFSLIQPHAALTPILFRSAFILLGALVAFEILGVMLASIGRIDWDAARVQEAKANADKLHKLVKASRQKNDLAREETRRVAEQHWFLANRDR